MPETSAPAKRGAAEVHAEQHRHLRKDIQGLRAVAVGAVVLYHAGFSWFPGGYVGVDVFFVISGFVITQLLLREHARHGRTDLAAFYARRARRILPAATLVAVVTVAASYLWLGFLRGNAVAADSAWSAVFLANFHFSAIGTDYFSKDLASSPLLHYWSLAVEEQFYLVFPAAVMLLGLRHRALQLRGRLALGLLLVIVSSLVLSVTTTASEPLPAFFLPFTRAWELALGAVLAILAPGLHRLATKPWLGSPWLGWLGLAAVAVAVLTYSNATTYPGLAVAVPVLGTAAVITAGTVRPGRGPARLLQLSGMQRLGLVSFSLYLWHFPILTVVAQATDHPLGPIARLGLVLLSVLAAELTYRFVEHPIRRAPSLASSTRRSLALGAGLMAGTLAIAGLGLVTHRPSTATFKGRAVASAAALSRELNEAAKLKALPDRITPALAEVGRDGLLARGLPASCEASLYATRVPTCTLGDRHAKRLVVLYGDSTAAMWSGAMDVAAKAEGIRLLLLSKVGCAPWLRADQQAMARLSASCRSWHRFAERRINQLRPEVVVMSGALGEPIGRKLTEASMLRLRRDLAPSGARLVLLGDIPQFQQGWYGPPPQDCLARYPRDLPRCTISVAHVERVNGPRHAVLEEGAGIMRAHFVDVRGLLCGSVECPPVVNHRVVYYNDHHITSAYSSYIGLALRDRLLRVLP